MFHATLTHTHTQTFLHFFCFGNKNDFFSFYEVVTNLQVARIETKFLYRLFFSLLLWWHISCARGHAPDYYFQEKRNFGLHFSDVMVIIFFILLLFAALLLLLLCIIMYIVYVFLFINEYDHHFERQAPKNIQMMANSRNNHHQRTLWILQPQERKKIW